MRQAQQTMTTNTVRINEISLKQLEEVWRKCGHHWLDAGPFVTPAWMKAWWQCLGGEDELLLLQVEKDREVLGIAPLLVRDQTARLIGSEDVCDYLDFLVTAGQTESFYRGLFAHLESIGIGDLLLQPVHSSSSVMKHLVPYARSINCEVEITPNNVCLNMTLPANWQKYLAGLNKKQRHEIRRKFRRFSEAGEMQTRNITDPSEVPEAIETFFQLFRQSHTDKDDFMVADRQQFFNELALNLAEWGMLDILQVSIDAVPAAMVFCFNYGSTTYLYNNGFNPDFRSVSPGIVSKVTAIRKSIEEGRDFFNFLNGNERYKYQLGGSEESLFTCRIRLKY